MPSPQQTNSHCMPKRRPPITPFRLTALPNDPLGKAVAPKSYNIDPSALKLGDTLSVGKRKGFKLV